ncbi:MAG TPA: DUF4159 domain-containing protein [Vicinamibacterales bacterium]|nr:DUF4159 domain-containing protein [Vicinamibacterales bacterium]
MRTISRGRLLLALILAVAFAAAAAALGQLSQDPSWRPRIWVGGNGRWYRTPPKWAKRENFDGSWTYCRGFYYSNRREAGGSGWDTDFPGADNNFSVRLAELTGVRVRLDAGGQPDYVVLRLTDPLLSRCSMVHLEDAGTAEFTEDEVAALRAYLLKGGFLTVDDFWGTAAWDQWAEEIGRVLPPAAYPIFDIPPTHPILHALYDVKEVEQVSNIRFWVQTGSTSERGPDSPHANFRGIADDQGRLMVVMTHNTDIPDTWEREGESKEYFDKFSPNGYAVGVNTVLYSLTH